MFQAIRNFFDTSAFEPHGHCFLWDPGILWLHVISDSGIIAAYYAIPLALLYFVHKRKDLPFQSVFLLFGAFIVLCGTTHIMGIWTLWHADYALEGVIKALTAIASIATFFVTVKLIPKALLFPSPAQLAVLNKELQEANRRLEIMYEQSKESGQARIRAMIDNALDAVIAMDEQGIINEWNRQAETVFGWSRDEALGRNITDLIVFDEQAEEQGAGLKRFLADRASRILNKRVEVSLRNRRGEKVPVELIVTAQQQQDGHAFTVFLRDLRDRRKAEETRGLLAAIVESSDDPIISKTITGVITSWNVAAERLFGYSSDEMIGRHISMLIPPDRLEEERDITRQLLVGHSVEHLETVRVTKDGRHLDISLTVSPIRDASGQVIGASKIVHDISERKRTEAQLKAMLEEVIVAKRVAEEAQHKAEVASRAKSEFLANMSHEIRTPLNSIIGISELLAHSKLNGEQNKYVEVLSTAGEMLLALINDILDFSKIESGAIDIAQQPVALKPLLEEIERVIAEPARANNITLKLDCPDNLPPAVVSDPVRLRQILLNLGGNAVKFSSGAHVTIRAALLQREGNNARLRFSVEDTGPGIPKDKLEAIFEKFTQLDEFSTKKYAGTGLGLAICKRLVELMGGIIGVESEVGKGSCFWFELPFKEASAEEAVPVVAKDKCVPMTSQAKVLPQFHGRVLLVEDYPPNREMAKHMLEKMGCTVDVAQNGEEALERMEEGRYDVVFMDCQMPEMDGFQTTAEIRKREKNHHTIIIAMTAHVLSGDRERCFQAGMDGYVSKPVRSSELGQVLKQHLAA